MLSPYEFAKTVIKCGTTAVVADPHEIANVCGVCGIEYMLKASENLPLDVYIMLPSCVPATDFDESYEKIDADKLLPFFERERIRKGQYVMIRHGTAAKNLHDLLALFDTEQRHRCVFATDDKEPSDLINKGHIDYIIRKAVSKGKSVISAIQMASLNAANCFSLADTGAVAPGYFADILVLDDLEKVSICDVYKRGRIVVKDHKVLPFDEPKIPQDIMEKVKKSINCRDFSPKDFYISSPDTVKKCNVIGAMPFGLITEKKVEEIDFSKNNGIDTSRDILKIAVAERHNNTGNIGLGFICGIGLKEGAIAATVSHDSHNIIVIGTNDCDMAIAANRLKEIGGGNVIVKDGKAVKEMPLPLGGLMSDKKVSDVAKMCEDTRGYVHALGVPENIAPFMNMAFVSLCP